VWQEFTYTDGTYPDATCNHCSLKLFKCQPSRNMLKHLASCPNLADPERTKWRRYGEPVKKQKSKRQKRKQRSATRSPEATQESVITGASLSQSQSQPTTPYAGGREENNRFQSDIARGFYAAGLPFRAIEVPRMRQALTILQPDMEKYLPTRKALAGKLLTDEYQREKDELIARLRDEPTLGVVSDGWSSVSKEKVVNYIVVSPLMRPQLWCTRRTGETEQTSEYVAEEIGSVIDEINSAAGRVVVVSVTTDNAPVMQKAWDILEGATTLVQRMQQSRSQSHSRRGTQSALDGNPARQVRQASQVHQGPTAATCPVSQATARTQRGSPSHPTPACAYKMIFQL
jgi:hypothetical protein